MKIRTLLALALVTPLVGVALAQNSDRPTQSLPTGAQDVAGEVPGMPPMPKPGEHHKWLEQLVGTWSVETEMIMEGQPPMKCTGTDTVRSLGGRWIVCDLKSEMGPMGPVSAMLTLGYDAETGKYQGTWVDSMTDHLWVYEGTLDSSRKILTLEATGPNMMDPTKGDTRYRDVIELKSADHRTLTSSALVDGKWIQFLQANYRKTK